MLPGVDVDSGGPGGASCWQGGMRPHCERHISTQQSIANSVCARAWYDLGPVGWSWPGELSLEIGASARRPPGSWSWRPLDTGPCASPTPGRCLLSNYMTGRDSNRGACARPALYQYALMEEKRPGEYFPVFEDERGTYILNSQDMCMIDHLPDLMEAGGGLHQAGGAGQVCLLCRHRHRRLPAWH